MCSTDLIERMIAAMKDELEVSGVYTTLRDIDRGYTEASYELDDLSCIHRNHLDQFSKLDCDDINRTNK